MPIENDVLYITIGLPYSTIPILNKVMSYVNTKETTAKKVAEDLKKLVASNPEHYGFKKGTVLYGGDLYYEIYNTVDSVVPIESTLNSPFRRMG